jgi:hypothetical protein
VSPAAIVTLLTSQLGQEVLLANLQYILCGFRRTKIYIERDMFDFPPIRSLKIGYEVIECRQVGSVKKRKSTLILLEGQLKLKTKK